MKPYYEALPSNFVPVHYDLSVYDINTTTNTFKGTVKLHLKVNEAADELSLNYRDLTVKSQDISIESDSTAIGVTEVIDYKKKDFFVIKFDQKIDPAKVSHIIVTITYDAVIQTNMTGLYRSEYTEDGEKKVMLSTQFEAPDARRAFPCFDEPALKATFSITLEVVKEWTGLSNMPVETVQEVGDLKRYVFQKTPKVSPYLVAWACGEFEYIEGFTADKYYDDKPLPVRIYTTKGYTKSAEFALEIAPKVVDYFSKVFQVKYPLPKLDLIAVHSFSHNAMENWGLITYRSNALLYDEKTSDISFKNQVSYVVSHELAHMWFGDLVTMIWWDELWLNEGFATYVGYMAVDYLFPEWNIFDAVSNESLQESLTLDALRSSHPIHVPVVDAIDVDQIFDAISYKKGCSIINMLSSYIGKDVFLEGVAKYLQKNQFGNATTEDLWDSISEVSGKPIARLMRNWVQKIGFPVVNVDFNENNLVLSQARFLSTGDVSQEEDDTVWWIPLNISIGPESKDFPEGISVDSFESKRVIIENFPVSEFFKINKNSTGFYRVNYSPAMIDNIILPNLDKMTVSDKIGLFSDVTAIAIAGTQETDTVTLLKLLKSIVDTDQIGDDYNLWVTVSTVLERLTIVFSGDDKISEGISNFSKYVYSKISSDLLDGVKLKDLLASSDYKKSKLISNVFNASGALKVPQFVDYAKQSFETWKSTGEIHPSLTFFVFSSIAGSPELTEGDFDRITREITNPSSLDSREQAVKALPSVSNPKYFDKLFQMFKDGTVPLMDIHYFAKGLTMNRRIRDEFWKFFKENYDGFYKELSTNIPILERFVRFTFVNYQSADMIKELQDFFDSKDVSGFARSYGQAVDTVKTNNKWYERDYNIVKQWLQDNELIQ